MSYAAEERMAFDFLDTFDGELGEDWVGWVFRHRKAIVKRLKR